MIPRVENASVCEHNAVGPSVELLLCNYLYSLIRCTGGFYSTCKIFLKYKVIKGKRGKKMNLSCFSALMLKTFLRCVENKILKDFFYMKS